MSFLLKVVKRALMLLAIAIAGSWLLACGLLYAKQTQLLYPAPTTGATPGWRNAQWLEIDAPDGKRVHAVYIAAADGMPTVAHFHGNGEELSGQSFLAEPFSAAGIGFYGVEYPGYGLSKDMGPPSEKALYVSSETALQHLREKLGVPNERLVLSGWSLGSGVATEMARRGFGSRLVLVSPYTSIPKLASRLFPFIPVSLLANDRYDTHGKAPEVKVPVLIVHGTRDEVIPFEMGETLSKRFANATFFAVEGARHNNVYSDVVIQKVIEFARGE